MKKLNTTLGLIGLLGLFAGPASAQFNPSSGFSTINNTCGTYFLQGSTYYDSHGVSLGSSLTFCVPPFTAQNSSAAVLIPQGYTNALLPVCATATKGLEVLETDGAATPVYNATATGGGTVLVPVTCNGTNWTNH